jgi:hypothetical protein
MIEITIYRLNSFIRRDGEKWLADNTVKFEFVKPHGPFLLKNVWKWDIGDFYYDKREGYLRVGVLCEACDYGEIILSTIIPLPRQDQLK